LVLEDTPEALYVLKQGQLESYGTSPTPSLGLLPPGAVIHLKTAVGSASAAVITVRVSPLGCSYRSIPAVVAQNPEIGVVFTPTGSGIKSAHICVHLRARAAGCFAPYLSNQGAGVGTSRYAVRLRQQIRTALDRQSV